GYSDQGHPAAGATARVLRPDTGHPVQLRKVARFNQHKLIRVRLVQIVYGPIDPRIHRPIGHFPRCSHGVRPRFGRVLIARGSVLEFQPLHSHACSLSPFPVPLLNSLAAALRFSAALAAFCASISLRISRSSSETSWFSTTVTVGISTPSILVMRSDTFIMSDNALSSPSNARASSLSNTRIMRSYSIFRTSSISGNVSSAKCSVTHFRAVTWETPKRVPISLYVRPESRMLYA